MKGEIEEELYVALEDTPKISLKKKKKIKIM